ncbi:MULTISPECIES: hypothetical protein [Eisenbergiella]|uniref:hypothetical protein n=1 Tax=Eisenbergiella TaxID=1432051 RepID=UPI0023F48586|nr:MULTISPECIES: hypothetical protein [Eisenbergiella]MCI6706464.1 hypothetical protein [Eisenbergiella massiliensis]MDY2651059.1 hypothetical protein [Eisenbergiella porci]MDY5525578.1 hypothetical protein [Eisenbergiella porci]
MWGAKIWGCFRGMGAVLLSGVPGVGAGGGIFHAMGENDGISYCSLRPVPGCP